MANVNTVRPGSYLNREQDKVSTATQVATLVWGCLAREDCPVAQDEVVEVTSFKNFKDTFKLTDAQLETSPLALAIHEYYLLNSGSVFVLNVGSSTDTKATAEISSGKNVEAKSPGTWGNSVKVTLATDSVKIECRGETEIFEPKVADINANSKFINVTGSATDADLKTAKTLTLQGGTLKADISGETLKGKVEVLLSEETITLVTCYVKNNESLAKTLTDLEKELGRKAFTIDYLNFEDGKKLLSGDEGVNLSEGYRGAVFTPCVKVKNPFTGGIDVVSPAIVAPSTFAYMLNKYGIAQAPAGVEAILPNVVGLEGNYTEREQGILNSMNVNCLVAKKKYGVVIWGNRLINSDQDRDYISDLLLDDYIDSWIKADTETFVFKNADDIMYSEITARITAFLRELWAKGALAGETVNEAFKVRCDKTLNADAKKGEVFAEVGWAKKYPAEFIYTTVKYISAR